MMAVSSELVRSGRGVCSPRSSSLRGIIEERFDGVVGLILHVAVDVPEVDLGVASGMRQSSVGSCSTTMVFFLSVQLANEICTIFVPEWARWTIDKVEVAICVTLQYLLGSSKYNYICLI